MAAWEEFALQARQGSGWYVESAGDWYVNLVEPGPPYQRYHVRHQEVGGMDFIEVLAPIGDPREINVYQALAGVGEKLCGLILQNGQLMLKLTVPLRGFDMTDWRWPLGAMSIFVREL